MKNNLIHLTKDLRKDLIEVLEPSESHHVGCSLSIIDIVAYLYFEALHVFPNEPKSPNRDIFILSKGHGALAVYVTLYKKGFFSKEVLATYDKNGSTLPEHISKGVPGVELSTGSLGHGLPVGLGFATSFINDKKDNKVVVLLSDGELDEGSNWEAIMYAGHHHLENLIVIVDLNGFQGYASTEKVLDLSPLKEKIVPFNWNVYEMDGHDFKSMENVFKQIGKSKNKKPHFIIAKTIKGKGIPFFEGKFESHYKSVDLATKNKILLDLKNLS
ncbi:MAG: transketolase [Candidatus Roizmanbacteria bacterium]|nr:transketolase [Candidatus Roizmanbacteria bacterium]